MREKETPIEEIKEMTPEHDTYMFLLDFIEDEGIRRYGTNWEKMNIFPFQESDLELLRSCLKSFKYAFGKALDNPSAYVASEKDSHLIIPHEYVNTRRRMPGFMRQRKITIKDAEDIYAFLEKITSYKNIRLLEEYMEKVRRRWEQKNPTPKEFQKEVIPGWSILKLVMKLGNNEEQVLSCQKVAGMLGLSYRQAYERIRPFLENCGYRFGR